MKITGLTKKTLYQKRMFILWWFIGLLSMTTLTMVFYPALKSTNLAQSFNSLPKALQNIAGSVASLQTIGGFIAQEIFALRIPLLTIILAIAIYNSLVSGEEQRGILETQLALPLTRTRILGSKLFSGVTIIVISSLGTFVGILIGLLIIKEHYPIIRLLRYTAVCDLLSLDFGLLAFMLGAALGKKGIALGISSAFAFLSYLITSLAASTPKLATLDKLSLFHYYQNVDVFNLTHLIVLASVGILFTVIAFVLFNRRDVKGL